MESTISAYRQIPEQFIVAREGFPFIAIALFAAIVLWLSGLKWPSVFAIFVACFIVYFFRNPERVLPQGDGLIVSPADGRVLSVTDGIQAPVTNEPSKKISIFMSVLNVHINRSPVAGRVLKTEYVPGDFFVASLDKASEKNERNAVVIEDGAGRKYVVVQIAGLVARRIVSYLREGDSLEQGDRIGLIRFGSRVDIYLPPDTKISVKAGDKVSGSSSVVARRL